MKSGLAKYKPAFLFGVAGVLGYFVDLAVTLLAGPLLGKYLARLPAFVCSSTTTWIFNRTLTFKGRSSNMGMLREWLNYVSLMLVGLIANYIAYAIVVSLLQESVMSTAIAVACGSLTGMVFNYLSSSKLLYNK